MSKKEIKKIDFIIDYNDESILTSFTEITEGKYLTLDKKGNIINVEVEHDIVFNLSDDEIAYI